MPGDDDPAGDGSAAYGSAGYGSDTGSPDSDGAADPIPFVDGHNDTALRVYSDDRPGDAFLEGETGDALAESDRAGAAEDAGSAGHLDLPRAQEAGMAAGIFAAFVPNAEDPATEPVDLHGGELPPAVDPAVARRVVFDQFALLHRWAAECDDFRLVGDVDDLEACLAGDGLGAVPHIEGAAAVRADLSNLDLLYAAGLRSLGPVWSRPNQFAEGVPFRHGASPDVGDGLTEAGRRLVRACNDRGIVVDCAHLNAAGFRDVLAETSDPPVVSHAGAHAICPATRNLTDEMLRAIGDRDGLVGLTFGVGHLHPEGASDSDLPLSVLADHVDHLVEVAGIDCVALGSDFDGATVPDAIGDVRGVQALFDELRERGYGEDELAKVARENWLRVFRETWD